MLLRLGIALTLACWMCPALYAQGDSSAVLRLLEPVGGEIYYTPRVSAITIRWDGVDDTTAVRLDYSSNNGLSWTTIADSARGGSYAWDIRTVGLSTFFRVRVSQLRPPRAEDNVVYRGHGNPVTDAWWSPSNERVVSVAADPHIWDSRVSASSPLQTLPGARASYYSVRWSADSSTIVTGSDDNAALVFDARTLGLRSTLRHPDIVTKVEIDSTGSWLFTRCDDNRVRVFNLPSTTPRATHNAGSTLDDMSINATATRVVLAALEARVYGRSVGLPLTYNQQTTGVISGAFSPDGSTICTIGGDASIHVWKSDSAKRIWSASSPREGVRSVVYSADGTRIAVGMADSTVTVWNAATGALVTTLRGYRGAVRMVAFTPDGAYVAGASDDNFARVHEVATGRVVASLQHGDDVLIVRWDRKGERLLTTSRDGTARIWQVLEVVLQSDTSAAFTIAPPPPAFARFTTTGDTLEIRESTTLSIGLEAAQFLELADIDSVRLRIEYDPSILFRTSSTFASIDVIEDVVTDTAGIRRSREQLEIQVPLPTSDAVLGTISFVATLGQDSVTALRITRVTQIGKGPGMRTETSFQPVLVRGICRAGNDPRLYTSLGTPLIIRWRSAREGIRIVCDLAETAPAFFTLYDVLGRVLWSDRATEAEQRLRAVERTIPWDVLSGIGIVVVETPTQSTSVVVAGGLR